MRQPFVGLVLAAVFGIVVADYFPAISRPILFIAILGALAGLRWSYGPLVFALVAATFFSLHSATNHQHAGRCPCSKSPAELRSPRV